MSPNQQNKVNNITLSDWSIEQLPGLKPEEKTLLISSGILTTSALVAKGKTQESKLVLASKLQIHLQYVQKWVALAEMASVPSVGLQYCGLLLHAGIASVVQLANTPPHRLHKQILRLQVATMQRRDLCPPVEQVQLWVQQAQTIGS